MVEFQALEKPKTLFILNRIFFMFSWIVVVVAKLDLTLVTPWTVTHRAHLSVQDFPGNDTGVVAIFLLRFNE